MPPVIYFIVGGYPKLFLIPQLLRLAMCTWYIALILLPWKQSKIESVEYEIYDVLFYRTFVRNIFHARKYLASYAANASSNAHTCSCRIPLFSTKCNRNV